MKVLVAGAQGMLGSSLLEVAKKKTMLVIGVSKEEMDIRNQVQIAQVMQMHRPNLVINCAAMTDVDGCERDPERAFSVNALGAENIARAAKEIDAHLIHLSTDYVFDGKGNRPYREEDLCSPINIYGMSKWEGEKRVLSSYPASCVVRPSWIFGRKGKNFISSLMKWFQEKEEVQVVNDQRGRPTYCFDLAAALLELPTCSGIFHFANTGAFSRYEIACALLKEAKKRGIELRCREIIGVTSETFPTPAPRPFYSVLDTTKITTLLKQPPREWHEAMGEFLHAL
jgi:dTDP-4-dehydrorhamnose reductase